jgi:hypothetical protein
MTTTRISQLAFVAAGLVLWSAAAAAQDSAADVRAKALLRAVAYDNALPSRLADRDLVVGVAFDPARPSSVSEKIALVAALKKLGTFTIKTHRFVVVDVALSSGDDVKPALVDARVDVVYVTSELDATVPAIVAASREHGILTATGTVDHVKAGIALGLTVHGGRLKLTVNLPAAKRAQVDFSSQLLAIATVIR